jgi:pimeloyl-ACP methyl ester carboxylesterase
LQEDLTPLLSHIATPTLILASGQDEITPLEVQHLMAQQMPKARLQIFEDVGHNMKVEIPDLLARTVRDFIGEIESA